ncbi:DUF4276 family protein [Mucilaginibacter mali]|uniref:DUF4276 family protein n=1 Tax=Mucilaginibacter mali TaxID=2740462 RepID=A0A7D4QIF3_9SPHI|nr:DUF4276 family protein [Mucilaginibacter mali]QKJ29070.1 DUF4276 family protein [Mucilaginibacter mali]
MIKVGLVGEDPSDTSSIKNLLEKRYKKQVQFCVLTPRIKGYHLDTKKLKDQLPIEAKDKKCNLVIFVRDLDDLASNKNKLKQRKDWFQSLNVLVDNKGVLLLNIWELEALILGDIDTFNAAYKTSHKTKANPMFQSKPKEFLKQLTARLNKQFHESHCPEIFKKLDIDLVEKNCSCFSAFITEFNKRLVQ